MSKISRFGALTLAMSLVAQPGWAACMDTQEAQALKIATLQQELMVAALTCSDISPYNRFVLSNRAELVRSDRLLQHFYSRIYVHRGTEEFQAVKTRLANGFSLNSLHDQQGFCAQANALFASLTSHQGSPLAVQVSYMPISIEGNAETCERDTVSERVGTTRAERR